MTRRIRWHPTFRYLAFTLALAGSSLVTTAAPGVSAMPATERGRTLSDALSAAKGAAVVLEPGVYVAGKDLEIPADLVLEPRPGALIRAEDGATVRVNGPIDAGPYRIFDASGRILLSRSSPTERILPQWWGVVGDGKTDNTRAMLRAIEGTPRGAVLFFPQGDYVFGSLTIHKALMLRGASWTHLRSPLGGRTWDVGQVGGTVLRSTVTSRPAILWQPEDNEDQFNLRDLALVGPGRSSKAEGIHFGAGVPGTGGQGTSGGSSWSNVLVGNFDTAVYLDGVEQCYFRDLRIQGVRRGLVLDGKRHGTNANAFFGLEVQMASRAGIDLGMGIGNYFYGGLLQANTGPSIVSGRGIGNVFNGFWLENPESSRSDVILSSSWNKVTDSHCSGGTIAIESGRGNQISGNTGGCKVAIGKHAQGTVVQNNSAGFEVSHEGC